ncbi:MAG: hypothetical protein ACI3ZY_11325 [Parabacteroides sp.]
MDKLKDFIDSHQVTFDEGYPLPQGHEARFMRKLEEEKTIVMPRKSARPKSLYLLYAVAMAASVALLLLLRFSTPHTPEAIDPYLAEVQQIQTEMEELQIYYHMQMRTIREQMKQLAEAQPTPGVMAIWQESELILADNHSFEQNELPQLPTESETLCALTQHYGNSLETLQFMLAKMEQMSETNERIN